MKNVLKHLIVLFIYVLLTCFLLSPLPAHLSTGLLEAQSGDPLMQIWAVQWNIHKLTTSLAHYFDANIFYPYSNTFAYHDHMFALGLIGLPIYLLTHNPIFTYNTLLMLSFILSAYGMYLLCKDFTHNAYAAFLAGLIFGFLPYRFAHLDHLNLLSIQWLPFCFLFLTRYLFSNRVETSRQDISTLILFWFFFLLQALTSFNYLFMLSFTVGIYLVTVGVQILICGKLKFTLLRKDCFALLIGGCVVGLLLLPFMVPYLKANREMGFQRTLAEAAPLSARLQDYLVTPENNLLYGQFTRTFQSPNSPFPREQMLFNGILPILLAILGILGVWNTKKFTTKTQRRKVLSSFVSSDLRGDYLNLEILRLTYIVLLFIAGILSLGPSATLLGKTVSLPYSWLYHAVPGFKSMRVPARFGLMVSFALAVLAAMGLSLIYEYVRKRTRFGDSTLTYVVVTALIGGMIVLEYYSPPKPLSFYPGTMATMETISPVYRWLAQQPDATRLIELPGYSAKDNFEYMYYSTFHWKRMVNGRSAFVPNGIIQIFEELRSFPTPHTIDLLKSLGVQYAIIHTAKLEQQLPATLPNGVSLLQTFDHDLLLEISGNINPGGIQLQYHLPSTLRPAEQYTLGILFKSTSQEPWSPLPQEKATFQITWKAAPQSVSQEFREITLPILIRGGDQVTLPMQFTTPSKIEDYRVVFEVTPPLFEPKSFTKRITIAPDVLDSRRPGKLQAEFLQVDLPEVWERGKPLRIRALVKNTGDTLWKARVADRKQPVGEVHLGVFDWQEASSGKSLKESQPQLLLSRGFLPYDVASGEEVVITTEIRTPDLAGEFLIQLDMVSELIQWFSQQGAQPFRKKITLK